MLTGRKVNSMPKPVILLSCRTCVLQHGMYVLSLNTIQFLNQLFCQNQLLLDFLQGFFMRLAYGGSIEEAFDAGAAASHRLPRTQTQDSAFLDLYVPIAPEDRASSSGSSFRCRPSTADLFFGTPAGHQQTSQPRVGWAGEVGQQGSFNVDELLAAQMALMSTTSDAGIV